MFFYPSDDFPSRRSYSLIELAIVADEPVLTMQLIQRFNQSKLIEPEDSIVGGQYVNLAAHYEAAKAMEALLAANIFLAAGTDQSADSALLFSRVFTEAGLKNIRMLVDSGASIEAVVDGSPTPATYAASEGDLWKLQCLYLMGATLPSLDVVEKRLAEDRLLDSRNALEGVMDYLSDPQSNISEPVMNACSPSST
ncbi:MAG: hypothetical protein AAFN50_12140 [Pseudomonadota bacterium]